MSKIMSSHKNQTWAIILFFFILKLLISPLFLLSPDETNYWQWSRYLALGYHDHPPLIAWTIWASTELFGHTEFAVRLPTILGNCIFSLYLSMLTARLFSWRCSVQLCLLIQCILLFNGAALITTPDGLLLPCWAACCYHAYQALQKNSTSHWLLTGMWFGMGMLSKYTMLFFLASLFLLMISDRNYRRQFFSIWPWAGLIISLILFSPVLIWNSQHDWPTFRHALYQGGLDNKELLTLRYIGDFLGSQVLLLGPVVFILCILSCFKSFRKNIENKTTAYLLWLSLPTLLFFSLLAFHDRIYGNWPAPAYICLTLLVAGIFSPAQETVPSYYIWWKTALVTAALSTILVIMQAIGPTLPIPISLDRAARETFGWDQLGKIMDNNLNKMPSVENTFIYGLSYQYASELAFYMPGQPRTVSINKWARPNVYDFWFDDKMLVGQDGIGVSMYKGMDKYLAKVFRKVDPEEKIVLTRNSPWFGNQPTQTLYITRGYGFKGGLRWEPKNLNDIRATPQQTE